MPNGLTGFIGDYIRGRAEIVTRTASRNWHWSFIWYIVYLFYYGLFLSFGYLLLTTYLYPSFA